jgi:general secretion pathway protein D
MSQLHSPLLRTAFCLILAWCSASNLQAQLREDALKPSTKTSPAEFRNIQSLPVTERPALDPLLAQNTTPTPAPSAPTTPPPAAPPTTPPDGAAPAPAPEGAPMGPGGFGGRQGGGRGFRSESTDVETFRIDGDKVSLQFPNNTITDILGIYERLTNKTLVKDTTIFEGQAISLVTPQPVEKDEAIKLIEAALLTNGYAIVADPNGKSARILPTRAQGTSASQFSQGVNFYQSAADLPDNETIVSYFMKLDHLDPTQAGQILGNHVGLNVYGRITPVLTPPGLLITENANIVKQLVSIKDVIDLADTANSVITKFIPLKYADAGTVAQIVQATLDAQATDNAEKGITTIRGQAPSSGRREGDDRNNNNNQSQQPQQGNSQSTSPGVAKVKSSSQVVADNRLNQILVVAEPEEYAYITSLIIEFDKAVDVPQPYERKLKNIYSVDVLSVLADLLKEVTTGATQLPGGGSVNANQQQLLTSSSQLLTGRNTTNARGGTFSTSTGTSSTSTGVTSRPDQLIEPEEDNAPISVLINKTRVIADPLANSIIVIGPKEDMDKVDMLLEKLDRKPPQVYLATVIGQLTLGDGYQFGIDYLQKFVSTGDNSGLTSAFITSRENIVTDSNVTDITNNLITSAIGNAKGFNVYAQLGDTVDAFVSALETTNDFKVLSRPSVFALNNKKAVITSGQSIPVPTQSLANANTNNNGSGNVTTTIEYKDVVLKLEVIPLINPDGNVTLKIAQVNDTVVGNQIVAQNNVPIIGTEQITTTVTVPNRQTIVLGGLITEEDKMDTEGIPFLSRIPGVGRLFKEEISSKTRKELIIFIQPVVVDDSSDLQKASLSEDLRTDVGGDAFKTFPESVIPKATLVDEPKPVEKKHWFDLLKKSDRPIAPAGHKR